MYTLEEMRKMRDAFVITYSEIAKASGVSISSVQKIFGSDDAKPRHSTMTKLSQAFDTLLELPEPENHKKGIYYNKINNNKNNNREENNLVADKNPGYNLYGAGKIVAGGDVPLFSRTGYTYEDYLTLELPEGKRIEIIDGVIYDMTTPSPTHQAILMYLSNYITNELRKRRRKCLVFMSPFDVRLDFSDGPTTVVQPDILIKCSKDNRVDKDGNEQPWVPRFVVEILSPSTRSKDTLIKTRKYKESGVVEYWIIDDHHKQVTKYNFDKDSISMFNYEDKIGIDIFDGDIVVDMKELQAHLDYFADIIGE